MAAATFIVSFIPMCFNIYNRILLNLQITILEEKWVLFPGRNLNIACQIDHTVPGIVADRSGYNPIHVYILTINLNYLGKG